MKPARRTKAKSPSFTVIGAILISDTGPSFGTPIFTDENAENVIQSSQLEQQIDAFVRAPYFSTKNGHFAPLRLNEPVSVGSPFLVAFRDLDEALFIHDKRTLKHKLALEFDRYIGLPFLLFAIARFLEESAFMERACAAPEIASALSLGELESNQMPLEIAASGAIEKPAPLGWTDARVAILKQLWNEGVSASDIAAKLGGISRNHVIGKIHRLGLSGRNLRTRDTKGRAITRKATPASDRRSLLELDETVCRWPLFEGTRDMKFCGKAALADLPYCEEHARQAYQLPSSAPTGLRDGISNRIPEIKRKHGNTLIRTLRKAYGENFAKGFDDSDQLGHVLSKIDRNSLQSLYFDFLSGKLAELCLRP